MTFKVQNLPSNPMGQRVLRKPLHPFQVRHKPWSLQPFMIAPVLPRETMKNLLLQSRIVTDPLLNPLMGWWAEYYFFYVKHRDLAGREDFTEMMLDPDKDLSAYYEDESDKYYTYGTAVTGDDTIPWVKLCLQRIVEEYFRNEGEAWDAHLIDGMPACQIGVSNWLDSVVLASEVTDQDVDVDLNMDTNIMASEVERAMQQWQLLRHHGLTQMTYEDYLATYGVSQPQAEELHTPELIRYIREWTYPSNTVDPTDGTPSSACSWAIRERADKDRFFAEPGFIVGVTVARPKVYLSGQKGSAVGAMNDAWSWLPAVMMNEYRPAMKQFAAGEGPLNTQAAGYWVDVRDLLLYGDQFVNFALTETDAGLVALPTTALQKRYASEAMADALWADQVTPRELVRQDGVVSLSILTHQRDVTATI